MLAFCYFAWFQATAAGVQVQANNATYNSVTIAVQEATYQADNYTATLSIVPYAAFNDGMVLVYSQWDSAWKHAFLKNDSSTEVWDDSMNSDQAAHFIPSATNNTLTNYLVYRVQLSGSPSAEQIEGIAEQTLTVYFQNSAGHIWVEETAPENGYGTSKGNDISTTISIPANWDGTTLTGAGYILASVNGVDDTVQSGGNNQATLTVTTTNPNQQGN